MDQTGTLKHFSKYLVWLPDHSVVPWFWFGWLWVVTVMTNKCLVRPETSQSRAGWGVVGCVPLSPVTPVVAGVCVGWPEPPEKVSRVSVSQCWLRRRSRHSPSLRQCETTRTLQIWAELTDSLTPDVSEIFTVKDTESDRSSWRHRDLMEEGPKIVKICGRF